MRVLLVLLIFSAAAGAETVKPVFVTAAGTKLSPEQALLATLKGTKVFKCTEVETKVSESGTSISLKNKKRD